MVRGCNDMWLEFNYKYTKNDIQKVNVKRPNGETLILMDDEEWKDSDNRLRLSRDRKNRSVTLLIRKLQTEDFKKYTFSFKKDCSEEGDKKVVEVILEGKRLLLLLLLLLLLSWRCIS